MWTSTWPLLAQYGTWIYAILFAIVFCETGLVVTPFLPGDSLLFVAGALAATSGGSFDINIVIAVLLSAAILGDNTNYWIGRWAGKRILAWGEIPAISTARPSTSRMPITSAWRQDHAGGALHALRAHLRALRRRRRQHELPALFRLRPRRRRALGVLAVPGRLLVRQHPWVKANLSLIIFGTIGLSLVPLFLAWLRHRLAPKAS
jgi:membrane-associated protein